MSAGYCYLCDGPVDDDVCSTCGRAPAIQSRPAARPKPPEPDQVLSPDAPPPPPLCVLPVRAIIMGSAAFLLLILLLLRWEIGM